ncbi:hypothetical protein H312_03370 [Anncaliia algerae PRA339]|uniref:Uncharacterized protein n=1 Tax=Anncaliia algerae PRA339 TaxID=1288291 RepID=A0A059EWI6_9MICR|nr:hypothetical protein H312_03370 [Anncaliia algerae PRA339]
MQTLILLYFFIKTCLCGEKSMEFTKIKKNEVFNSILEEYRELHNSFYKCQETIISNISKIISYLEKSSFNKVDLNIIFLYDNILAELMNFSTVILDFLYGSKKEDLKNILVKENYNDTLVEYLINQENMLASVNKLREAVKIFYLNTKSYTEPNILLSEKVFDSITEIYKKIELINQKCKIIFK